MGDSSKHYCRHCSRPDGSMRSYDEALEGTSMWLIRTQGVDASVARQMAIEAMARLPAWAQRQ